MSRNEFLRNIKNEYNYKAYSKVLEDCNNYLASSPNDY